MCDEELNNLNVTVNSVLQWKSQGVHPVTVKVIGGRNVRSHIQILQIQNLQKMKDKGVDISHQGVHIPRRG